MTKSLSSILLVLILAASALAGPLALAEEAATRPAAADLEIAAAAAEPVAPAASGEALFLAGTSCAPVSGKEKLGEAQEPLFTGGVPCNERRCGPREFCCNFSCSICGAATSDSPNPRSTSAPRAPPAFPLRLCPGGDLTEDDSRFPPSVVRGT